VLVETTEKAKKALIGAKITALLDGTIIQHPKL
jgi:hypothetical protein